MRPSCFAALAGALACGGGTSSDGARDDLPARDGGGSDDGEAPRPGGWRGMSAGAPAGRGGHVMVWTGSEAIVWGGERADGPLQDGARYDPAADAWTRLPEEAAPSARTGHTAVWTGTEMIVWGGRGPDDVPANVLGDGRRYAPAMDRWLPTAEFGAEPRDEHTAVWTGSEMIVWGGNYGGALATGGRYAPDRDRWEATSQKRAPFKRRHTAVWTGEEMIVWGGLDGAADNGPDGARYDPRGDAWTPMAGHDGLVSLYGHTAVWDGRAMWIWGGVDQPPGSPCGRLVASGGRYEAKVDRWRPTPPEGAPAPRWRHSAVWDGRAMIVWGGSDYNACRERGGVFSDGASLASDDTWEAVEVDYAPRSRRDHAAVWTGTEMIVWGGWDGRRTRFADGGRYAGGRPDG